MQCPWFRHCIEKMFLLVKSFCGTKTSHTLVFSKFFKHSIVGMFSSFFKKPLSENIKGNNSPVCHFFWYQTCVPKETDSKKRDQ